MRLFSKSLAIGLPASRVGFRKDRSCPSISDRLDPPTFPTLCKDITLVMRLFSKSLAIGLPASRIDAYLRRPDSVRVYWTTLNRLCVDWLRQKLRNSKKTIGCEVKVWLGFKVWVPLVVNKLSLHNIFKIGVLGLEPTGRINLGNQSQPYAPLVGAQWLIMNTELKK